MITAIHDVPTSGNFHIPNFRLYADFQSYNPEALTFIWPLFGAFRCFQTFNLPDQAKII